MTRVVAANEFSKKIQADIEMKPGVLLTGRILDKESGQGVESRVSWLPSPSNQDNNRPRFARESVRTARTDSDGRYRIVVPAGQILLTASAVGAPGSRQNGLDLSFANPFLAADLDAEDSKALGPASRGVGCNAWKSMIIEEKGAAPSCDLQFVRGKSLTVNVVDPAGRPKSGVLVGGINALPMPSAKDVNTQDGVMQMRVITVEVPTFEVHGLAPNKPRQLILIYPELDLAAAITLTGEEKSPLTVQLKRTGSVTGHVLDTSGKAIQDGRIAPVYSDSLGAEMHAAVRLRCAIPTVDTHNGNFHIEGLVPGMQFRLGVYTQSPLSNQDAQRLFDPPKAGETVDLGRIR